MFTKISAKKFFILGVLLGSAIGSGAGEAVDPLAPGLDLLKRRGENPNKFVPDALAIFRAALAKQPTDERTLAATIYAYTLMGGYGLLPAGKACDEAEPYVRKLKVKPATESLTEYSLGRWEMWCERQISAALPHFIKASSKPSEFKADALLASATVHLFRHEVGRTRDILKQVANLKTAGEDQFLWFELYLGDYAKVLEKTAEILKTKPEHVNARAYRARAYLARGLAERRSSPEKAAENFREAESLFKAICDSLPKPSYNNFGEYITALAYVEPAKALPEYRKLEGAPIMSYRLAQMAIALNLPAEAERHFNDAVNQRESNFLWVGIDPVMKELRENSSAIKSKMAGMGLR